jgi:selenocysteine lyase/cysteine desulfurase
MLDENGLTTAQVSSHVEWLQKLLLDALEQTPFGEAELLNPLDRKPHARFLAFRSDQAQYWRRQLADRNCVVDVRGDVLRIGLGLYHDESDIGRFAELAAELHS